MVESEFQILRQRIERGASSKIGRNAAGRSRLKLYTGPFGWFVQRFDLDDAELEQLRQLLALSANKRKSAAGQTGLAGA